MYSLGTNCPTLIVNQSVGADLVITIRGTNVKYIDYLIRFRSQFDCSESNADTKYFGVYPRLRIVCNEMLSTFHQVSFYFIELIINNVFEVLNIAIK